MPEHNWLWYPGTGWNVDDHIFARKEFSLAGPARSAVCRITAHTHYVLFINGRYVGRGPVPSDPEFQSVDTHDVAAFLREGKNVIAVVAHNYGIGTHWCHRNRGSLVVQLDAETKNGTVTVAADDTWRVKTADCFAPNSPRMFWSCGFVETFDFRKYDERWLAADFDDSAWSVPEIFGPNPLRPRRQLIPREIPLLREQCEPAVAAEKGAFTPGRVHAVRFDSLLAPGSAGIVYAETFVHSAEDRPMVLHVECDDAFKLFLNGELAAEKNYNQHFARTRVWRAKDEYEQVHYGMGASGQFRPVTLKKGWNQILVGIDHGVQGWGFALAFLDPADWTPQAVEFAAGQTSPGRWHLAGPLPSTGMNDSLNAVDTDLAKVPTPKIEYDPFNYEGVTDYAALMRYEKRTGVHACPDVNAITLQAGEFCIIDLERVRVGFPRLEIAAEGESILDIGLCQLFHPDRGIRFSNSGDLKYVDRVYTRPGLQTWQPLHRRTGRFVHVSCRKGRVTIQNAGLITIGYPVETKAEFECSDPVLNRIWDVSRYTTALLMQYGYQDCMKREQGTFNTSSFNYMSRAAACCFGDHDLARKTFRLAFRLQDSTGWFHSHGISSPNCDEHVECLWLLVWLRDWYLYSGDRKFIRECFDAVEDNLRYFSRNINEHGLLDERNYPVFRQGQIIYLDDSLTRSEGYEGAFAGETSGMNIMYYAALTAAADLAADLGRADRADLYRRKAARVQKALADRLWHPGLNRYADSRKNDQLTTTGHPILQIAALYFGVCNDTQKEHLLRYLCEDFGLPDDAKPDYPLYTFGFYFYFLEDLFRHGKDDLAYRLLRTFYGRWLELGPTTFGEFFRPGQWKGKELLDEEYEVHGYGTSAHLHLYANILGIRPARPGFSEIQIAPRPGDLTWAKGRIYTPKGPVQVTWRVDGPTFALAAEVPSDCRCEVQPPRQFARHEITINGKKVTRTQ